MDLLVPAGVVHSSLVPSHHTDFMAGAVGQPSAHTNSNTHGADQPTWAIHLASKSSPPHPVGNRPLPHEPEQLYTHNHLNTPASFRCQQSSHNRHARGHSGLKNTKSTHLAVTPSYHPKTGWAWRSNSKLLPVSAYRGRTTNHPELRCAHQPGSSSHSDTQGPSSPNFQQQRWDVTVTSDSRATTQTYLQIQRQLPQHTHTHTQKVVCARCTAHFS